MAIKNVAKKAPVAPISQEAPESQVNSLADTQTVSVNIDMSNEVILQLNLDPKILLEWSYRDFRKLGVNVVEKLRLPNMKSYVVAETKFDMASKAKAANSGVIVNPMNPLGSNVEAIERIRPRTGWHQSWAGPGRDYEAKKNGPYTEVRDFAAGQNEKNTKPGEERGEIRKQINGVDGKVVAIAVECPQEIFEQYLAYVSQASTRRITGVKQDFFGQVENINRNIKDKASRIKPIDYSGEMQE